MKMDLRTYYPIADGIARLFGPHVEVVVHNHSTGKIAYIANALSKRRVGDESLISDDEMHRATEGVSEPYRKTNWNGHRMRSVTVNLTDAGGALIGHLCINHDLEAFAVAQEALVAAVELKTETDPPRQLFAIDWREEVNTIVGDFLTARGVSFDGLMSEDIDELLRTLATRGVFEIRTAAAYVASVLGCSRATLYARLKRVRAGGADSRATIEETRL